MPRDYFEAKTRKDLIDPRLTEARWFKDCWQIAPEYAGAAGRIHFDVRTARREEPLDAGALLQFKPSKVVAIVEARKEAEYHLEDADRPRPTPRRSRTFFTKRRILPRIARGAKDRGRRPGTQARLGSALLRDRTIPSADSGEGTLRQDDRLRVWERWKVIEAWTGPGFEGGQGA